MDQDATWYGRSLGLGPSRFALDGDQAPPEKVHSTPHFAYVYCG